MDDDKDLPAQLANDIAGAFLNSEAKALSMERAVGAARNGIIITDPRLPDNPIVYANNAFSELTGYGLDEIIGKNCRFLQGADREQPELMDVRKAIKEGRRCVALVRNYKKDGTLFWNELSISPVHDQDGKLVNFIGVQNDLTARKEAERRISEFYSMVSHELRTPLSSIRASIGLVLDGSAGSVPAPGKRLLDIASQNAARLLKLVDDILDLKKMEAGKMALDLAMIEPRQLVSEVIDSMSLLAKNAEIKLIQDIKSNTSFCGDPDRISQVLINLLANAIKFSPERSTVIIKTLSVESGIKFLIIDEGVGIEDEDHDKLFMKFQQLDSSDTRAQTGSGLGLAISKTIVELHGGSIGLEKNPERGTCFWFQLPLVPKDSV